MTPTKEKKMAENLAMTKDATPKKVAFVSKPYSRDEKIKKDEEELQKLKDEQKGKTEEKEETEEEKLEKEEPKNAEEKTFKKRYGDLRRHTQQKERDLQKQIDELKVQLTDATQKEMHLPKSDEDIEQWAKDYPDVAAIVETIAMKKATEQSKVLEERIKSIDELGATAAREKAEAELLRIHPDFSDIRDSDDFHEWADEQPKWVQDALYENDTDARSAARAIDLYKTDKNIGKEEKPKTSNRDAAKVVKTKSNRSEPQTDDSKSYLKESDVQKMSGQEYEKRSDEVMEAIRSGKFIYDISGNAR
jgi:hypothetical protein